MEYRHQDANYRKDPKGLRIAVGIGLPTAGALAALLFWLYNPANAGLGGFSLFCPFYKLTGLYCPGCGMMRAAHELLHLHILQAVRDNALVVLILGPLGAYFAFREYIHYVLDRELLPALRFKGWMFTALWVMALAFTVIRNIPGVPFCYLTPIA